MNTRLLWLAVVGLLISLLLPRPLPAQPLPMGVSREDQVVTWSANVLDEIMMIPANSIPRTLLANAHAVVIIPNVVKGGFVVGIRHGRGVVLIRDEVGRWRPPLFVTLTSGSVGWQAGVQATDLIMVFQTRQSVNTLLNGRLTLGVDAAAAAGPVGRQATAATDTSLSSEILSYSRSRGLFAGFALDGASIQIDNLAGARFYPQQPGGTEPVAIPPSAVALVNRLSHYSGLAPEMDATAGQPLLDGSVAEEELIRQQLVAAWQGLAPLLDARWRTYLQLPAEIVNGGKAPANAAVAATLERYRTVAADGKFTTLTRRPEFVATHQLLRQYSSLRSQADSAQLNLPPPPQSDKSSVR